MAGWRVQFDGLPARQGVVIVCPRTSNWDFVVGNLAKWSIDISMSFRAKLTLFGWPLPGRGPRWLGGIPIDRSAPQGVVAKTVGRLEAARDAGGFMWLAVTPEGTRACRNAWRSGFHQGATRVSVPLGLEYFDYAQRCIGVHHFLVLGGDLQRDMETATQR
jgi:1-acyl-sn-glycerol-3-phosphate acyltransferase